MLNPETPRCFISAAAGTDTSAVRRVLEDLGVVVTDAYGLAAGESILSSIHGQIRKSSFLVVVLSAGSPNTYYEVGFAAGRGKPIFVIAPRDAEIPLELLKRAHYRGGPNDEMVLREALKRFVESQTGLVQPSKRWSRPTPQKKSTLKKLNHQLARLAEVRADDNPVAVERFVQSVLQELDVTLVSQSSDARDSGADFAVWNDDLAAKTGNPILIEVKAGRLNENALVRAESKLEHYMAMSDAQFALLLYLDSEGRTWPRRDSRNPSIVRFELEEFVRALARESLATALLQVRNQQVHGARD